MQVQAAGVAERTLRLVARAAGLAVDALTFSPLPASADAAVGAVLTSTKSTVTGVNAISTFLADSAGRKALRGGDSHEAQALACSTRTPARPRDSAP